MEVKKNCLITEQIQYLMIIVLGSPAILFCKSLEPSKQDGSNEDLSGQHRVLRQEEALQHFRNFRQKFYLKFWILFMFYKFRLLPQLKIERSESA